MWPDSGGLVRPKCGPFVGRKSAHTLRTLHRKMHQEFVKVLTADPQKAFNACANLPSPIGWEISELAWDKEKFSSNGCGTGDCFGTVESVRKLPLGVGGQLLYVWSCQPLVPHGDLSTYPGLSRYFQVTREFCGPKVLPSPSSGYGGPLLSGTVTGRHLGEWRGQELDIMVARMSHPRVRVRSTAQNAESPTRVACMPILGTSS